MDVDIPGIVIVVQGTTVIPLLFRLLSEGMGQTTGDLRDPLVSRHMRARFSGISTYGHVFVLVLVHVLRTSTTPMLFGEQTGSTLWSRAGLG